LHTEQDVKQQFGFYYQRKHSSQAHVSSKTEVIAELKEMLQLNDSLTQGTIDSCKRIFND